jgi:NADPH:quinone reductase-like Zn-dependent oxidoreductase
MRLLLNAIDEIVLDETPNPAPGPGEVEVEIEAATVNPSDLKLAAGKYGYRPEFPFPLGTEGVGRVVAAGTDEALVGRRVLVVPNYQQGTWADRITTKAANVVPIGDEGDPLQLAMVGVNPLTAQLALTKYVDLRPGDWIGQNLGNSAVGQAVTALAKRAGLRTLSVVRRPEAAEGLESDVVLVDGPELADQIAAAVGEDRLRLVLDGTGDATVVALAQSTELDGTVVSYSSVTGQLPPVGLGDYIYRQLRLAGLWIINWTTTAPRAELEQTYGELARLTADGVLRTHVEATYSLPDYKHAIEHAQQKGKILFRP